MLKSEEISLLLRALRFAAAKHRDQRRKDREASPYVNHPIEVAETLNSIGGVSEPAILAAAILHDTIEDTKTLPDEIGTLFGEQILSLVLEVTDDKSLPKVERKRLQIEMAPHKSSGAKQIKVADKICNIQDITNSPPYNWTLERRAQYLDWTEKVVAGLRGANPGLDRRYDEALERAKAKLKADASNQ